MAKHPKRDMDGQVGRRLKAFRVAAGVTQAALGDKLGISRQMVDNYERGHSRVSAGTLHRAAQILGQPVAAFFDGPENPAVAMLDDRARIERHHLVLVRRYNRLTRAQQDLVRQMLKAMAPAPRAARAKAA